MATTKNIKQIVESMKSTDAAGLASAVQEAIGDNNVTVGSTVAIVSDPTYTLDGQKGKVKSINNGFAQVEIGGITAPFQINLLIPVNA
jgi:hypothetical protein